MQWTDEGIILSVRSHGETVQHGEGVLGHEPRVVAAVEAAALV